jgi:hypothetical protein
VLDDAAKLAFKSIAGAVQAESLTREYHIAPNQSRETGFINGHILIPIPPELILLPGWSIRVYDSIAVDPTADDLTVSLTIDDRELKRADVNAG